MYFLAYTYIKLHPFWGDYHIFYLLYIKHATSYRHIHHQHPSFLVNRMGSPFNAWRNYFNITLIINSLFYDTIFTYNSIFFAYFIFTKIRSKFIFMRNNIFFNCYLHCVSFSYFSMFYFSLWFLPTSFWMFIWYF